MNALPNTTVPPFDANLFNARAEDRLNVDIVHTENDGTKIVYIVGPMLYHMRNVVFKQRMWDATIGHYTLKNEETNYEYGIYLEQKGYIIKYMSKYDEASCLHAVISALSHKSTVASSDNLFLCLSELVISNLMCLLQT